MPRGIEKERKLDRVLISFVSELAHYLLAAGVGRSRFESIVRLAYFRAASSNARFSNEKLNQSAVAAMTGLTRAQVRAFARQTAPEPSQVRDRLEQILEGWMTDRRFCAAEAQPKALRTMGRGNTFRALTLKYGGDVPPRSLLREMQRQGYITLRGNWVSLRPKARETYAEARIRRIAATITNLMAFSSSAASPLPARTLNSEISYQVSSEKGRHLMHRIASARLHEFLEGLKVAGNSVAMEAPVRNSEKIGVTRTRVAVITEEIAQEKEKDERFDEKQF